MQPAPPPAPAERFACLIEGLCRAIAARSAADRLAVPLLMLVWSRLRRMAARFAALAGRVRAAPGQFDPGAARPAAKRPGRSGPPPHRLPQKFAWLIRLVPQAAAGASQLRHLLDDPEMAALIAAAPQAGRILRPLCRMLGVVPPPGPLAPPPRSRAPPAPPADPAAPAGLAREAAPPDAAPRPARRRCGAGWVPRRRMFVWRPPDPA